MADRDSATIFSEIFTRLGSDPTEQHVKWAHELWKLTQQYDFSAYQLECDEALQKLGLAWRGLDPDYPEDGVTWLYGPVKKRRGARR